MGILPGKPWKIAENRTLKWGSSPPPSRGGNLAATRDHTFNRFLYRSAKWPYKLIASLFANLLSKPQITYSASLGLVE
jgi:hypothetical protein